MQSESEGRVEMNLMFLTWPPACMTISITKTEKGGRGECQSEVKEFCFGNIESQLKMKV